MPFRLWETRALERFHLHVQGYTLGLSRGPFSLVKVHGGFAFQEPQGRTLKRALLQGEDPRRLLLSTLELMHQISQKGMKHHDFQWENILVDSWTLRGWTLVETNMSMEERFYRKIEYAQIPLDLKRVCLRIWSDISNFSPPFECFFP